MLQNLSSTAVVTGALRVKALYPGEFFRLYLSSVDFYSKSTFFSFFFRNTISVKYSASLPKFGTDYQFDNWGHEVNWLHAFVEIQLLSTLCPPRNFSCFFVICCFFQNQLFEKFFQEYHQSVKQFGPRSGTTFVGPDLGPICLQRLSADDTRR